MFRFFTVYGPWGRPDLALYKFVDAILDGRPIDIYNHGDMYRDFTYVDDIAEGVATQMAHMNASRWIREHFEDVIFGFRRVRDGRKRAALGPGGLPFLLGFAEIVAL